MRIACQRRSLRLVLIACVCGCFLSCGSADNRPSIHSPVTSVSATKNPLVAQYFISSQRGGQARVEFGPDTSYRMQTAWYAISPGQRGIAILVAGMRASTTYHMRAEVSDGTSGVGADWFDQDHVFVTGPLPSIQFPTLMVTRPGAAAPRGR